MAARIIIAMIVFQVVYCEDKYGKSVNDALLNTFSKGVKFAKDFLGSETVALKVAEFVVRAFQPQRRRPHNSYGDRTYDKDRYFQNDDHTNDFGDKEQESQASMDPLRHIIRLFGLQPPQMSAVAVNALLFVAQIITTFLTGPHKSDKPYRADDLKSWIFNKNSRELQTLLNTARNESLPNMIEDIIKYQGNDEETSCIRLLICKITPFVVKMQESVFGKSVPEDNPSNKLYRGASIMYRSLPSNEEINASDRVCEEKYPACDLNH